MGHGMALKFHVLVFRSHLLLLFFFIYFFFRNFSFRRCFTSILIFWRTYWVITLMFCIRHNYSVLDNMQQCNIASEKKSIHSNFICSINSQTHTNIEITWLIQTFRYGYLYEMGLSIGRWAAVSKRTINRAINRTINYEKLLICLCVWSDFTVLIASFHCIWLRCIYCKSCR